MEVKLLEAAIAGDPLELERLIKEDPDGFNRVTTGGAAEGTPLHIAAQLGHTEFVAKIGILKPEFAHAKNSEGRCPLHLASAKGHVETVAELLEINSDVCFFRDRDGRTPLHIAAMKGRTKVLEKLAEKKIKAAWVLADCGQPILHLCANHNQFDALTRIIDRVKDTAPEKLVEFVNLKDDDDNTILHLLAAKAQYQVIKFLFPEDKSKNVFKVDVNAINQKGSTALDVLPQNCGPLVRMRIKFLLGDRRVPDIPGSKFCQTRWSMWDSLFERKEGEKSETRDALMVVAILIASVTFQAQINPPGGVWQQDGNITISHKTYKVYAGKSVMASTCSEPYFWHNTFNSVGFVASLILILLLVSGFTLRRKVSAWALTVTTWIAVTSMFVVFGVSSFTLNSKANSDNVSNASTMTPTRAPSMAPAPSMIRAPVAAPAPRMMQAPQVPSTAPAPRMLQAPHVPSTAPAPSMAPAPIMAGAPSMAPVPIMAGAPYGGGAELPKLRLWLPLLVALMILLALLVLASGVRYIWMHRHKGITRSVKRGFKRLFCCPCFQKSSERDSEGRTDMNA